MRRSEFAADSLEFREPFSRLRLVGGGVAAEIPRLPDLVRVQAQAAILLKAPSEPEVSARVTAGPSLLGIFVASPHHPRDLR